jgi:hypothetical protein
MVRAVNEARAAANNCSVEELNPPAVEIPPQTWPTPAAHEARLGYQDRSTGKKGTQQSLTTVVINRMGGRDAVSGQLNPEWVEWLMGVPIGWTELDF